jgi:hypothetical protein
VHLTCRHYLGGLCSFEDFAKIVRAALADWWEVQPEAVKGIFDVSS